MHLLVPGAWTVQQGHDLVERIENTLRSELPGFSVVIHLEPIEDPAAWADQAL
jgi:divalent metal cation (Fe/Co/Zn/Cd) transporter